MLISSVREFMHQISARIRGDSWTRPTGGLLAGCHRRRRRYRMEALVHMDQMMNPKTGARFAVCPPCAPLPRARRRRAAMVLLSAVALASAAAAQEHFLDETSLRLPDYNDSSFDIEPGDIDGDGDLDLYISNYVPAGAKNFLLINDGDGFFSDETDTRMPGAPNEPSRDGSLGDIDGDGDIDLLVANVGYQNRLFVNDGSGYFAEESALRLPPADGLSFGAALGDVDGDGDIDIAVVNRDEQNRLLVNDGLGYFSDLTDSLLPAASNPSRAVAVGDVEGDGDLDLVIGNDARQNRLLINDGSGLFVDDSRRRMPALADTTYHIRIGDVSGDSLLDLFVANFARYSDDVRLLINTGAGAYRDETSWRIPSVPFFDEATDGAIGDVDGDGDFDLFVARYEQNSMYINVGAGVYVDSTETWLPEDISFSQGAAFSDVDGDHDLDLLVANSPQRNRLLINQYGAPDTTPPVLAACSHPPDTYDTLGPYAVTVTGFDNTLLLDADLLYRAGEEPTFDSLAMRPVGGSLFRGEIPGQAPGTVIRYYVEARDRPGNVARTPPGAPVETYDFEVLGGVGVEGEQQPAANPDGLLRLGQNCPNPFSQLTTINCSLPEDSPLPAIRVYNISGQLIRTIEASEAIPGRCRFEWDGRDEEGVRVACGLYLYVLDVHGDRQVRKAVFLRP
ncbi:hypothetical protein AMJ71_03245 [candidate division TA06 bacterium SM1_40]|uniref:FlgD/Vpr Ig-like domain-containing protein n=1 Tax=candidate division TA06 bacterium SM1_40 TaxID=1703773 RepID=A0A0S8JLH5_UNCT6|nr:MAG: hypothetical protein AMJ71_03245 [candidate division TA06 bacterium SM1_40]